MVYVKYSLQLGLHSHFSYQIHHGLLADLKLFHKSTKPHNHNVKEITIIEISDPNYLSQMFSAMILVKISQLPKTDEISGVLWLTSLASC